jgi:hypothetical protein
MNSFNGYVQVQSGSEKSSLSCRKLTSEEKEQLLSREDKLVKELKDLVGFRKIRITCFIPNARLYFLIY